MKFTPDFVETTMNPGYSLPAPPALSTLPVSTNSATAESCFSRCLMWVRNVEGSEARRTFLIPANARTPVFSLIF